jgi:hypothetical protein
MACCCRTRAPVAGWHAGIGYQDHLCTEYISPSGDMPGESTAGQLKAYAMCGCCQGGILHTYSSTVPTANRYFSRRRMDRGSYYTLYCGVYSIQYPVALLRDQSSLTSFSTLTVILHESAWRDVYCLLPGTVSLWNQETVHTEATCVLWNWIGTVQYLQDIYSVHEEAEYWLSRGGSDHQNFTRY